MFPYLLILIEILFYVKAKWREKFRREKFLWLVQMSSWKFLIFVQLLSNLHQFLVTKGSWLLSIIFGNLEMKL